MDPTYWMGHGFGYMWIFPIIFLLIFFFFMRGMFGSAGCQHSGKHTPPAESARDILDKRFAQGEISKDEYAEMKESLSSKS